MFCYSNLVNILKMKVLFKKVSIFLAFIIIHVNAIPQPQIEKHQATFIYNFTRQIQWPNIHTHIEFVIGVIGKNSSITSELKASCAGRNVGGREIKIVEFSSVEDMGFCHLLFVPNNKVNQLKRISEVFATSPVLIVTEMQGRQPAESDINIYVENEKMVFRVNESNAKARNLLFSSQLVQYSKK